VGNEDEPTEELVVPMDSRGGAIARAFSGRDMIRIANGEFPESMRLAPPYSELKSLRSREFVAIPLIVEDTVVGVVAADNQLSKIPITRAKIAGIELFINQAAVAIQNSNMYERLRVHAEALEITDHLTHTYTFEHFKEIIAVKMSEAKSGLSTISLGVMMVGNFGTYNRVSGHRNGDNVLASMAETIKAQVGDTGIVGRCFGSTFGILLSSKDGIDADAMLASIINKLSSIKFQGEELLEEGKLIFLSASLDYDADKFDKVDDYVSRAIEDARGG